MVRARSERVDVLDTISLVRAGRDPR